MYTQTNSNLENRLLMVDSYKASHSVQYPPDTEATYFYVESRGGDYPSTVFFGLQPLLMQLASERITEDDVKAAAKFFAKHGEPFPAMWRYIVEEYEGRLPIRVRAVPEGLVVPTHNVLMTVESTDPLVPWLPGYLETQLMRQVWYPTTVATLSYYCKQDIYRALKRSSDDPDGQISFKLHDFGGRGVSSHQSAQLGGAAHLVNFLGSDTVEGVAAANFWYDSDMAAFSIPAMEHSTVTAWGLDGEIDAYRNFLKQYAKSNALIAAVSDSYDIWNAIENIWGGVLRDEVVESGATVVVRLDSGNPTTTVCKALELLDAKFGHTMNGKGYRVLNNVRVLQGDGINPDSLREIMQAVMQAGYSMDNVAFGMGGGLLQQVNRDTLNFAMKLSAIKRNGVWQGVSKSPVGSTMKKSRAGRLLLYRDGAGYHTVSEYSYGDPTDILETVFENGVLLKRWTMDEIRKRASSEA